MAITAQTAAPEGRPGGPEGRPGGGPHRSRGYDPDFSLLTHLLKTGTVAAVLAAVGIYLARGAPLWQWLLLPGIFLVANLVEWTVHRFPMHRPLTPRILYKNHAGIHHGAFKGEAMEIERTEDLCLVMMPWYTLFMIFVGVAPFVALTAFLLGPGFAGVFLVGAVAYFLFYELVHTLHHLRWEDLQARGLGFRWLAELRGHHHHHHQPANMNRVNFNVTFPVADRLLGTRESVTSPDRASHRG